VQADGGLVEDVEDAGQAAADLAREADALRLAAGERRRRATQRNVIEPDIDEKLHAVLDFAQYLAGDLLLFFRQGELLEVIERLPQRPGAHFANGVILKAASGGVILQTRACASGAGDVADEIVEPLAIEEADACGFAQGGHDALVLERRQTNPKRKRGILRIPSFALRVRVERNPRVAGAVKQQALMRRFEFAPRSVERESAVRGQRLGEARERLLRRQLRPRGQRTVAQRQFRIAHQHRGIGAFLRPDAFARRAPAERAVERKMMRIERLEAAAALIAGEVLAVAIDLPLRLLARVVDMSDVHHALAEVERGFDGLRESAALVLAHDETIDHDLDQMLAAMIDRGRRIDVERLAIDAHAHEA
jgi:hypothetical protein